MEWRKSNHIDGILAEDFTDVENEISVVFQGEDKQGHPIAIFNVGAINLRKVAISGKIQKAIRYVYSCVELVETVLRHISNDNTTLTRAFFIIDLHGFNIRQHICGQCIRYGVV